MVLQSLRKSVDFYKQKLDSITGTNTQQFELLKGLPFYSDWNNNCQSGNIAGIDDNNLMVNPCHLAVPDFNHAIGLPQKNGQPFPLFDYEFKLYDTLQKHKHVWIKKATGLGVTEFMLRYMAWLCFNGESALKKRIGSQMCIVTGPRIELAITLIDRMKGLFTSPTGSGELLGTFDTKETVIELNGVHIEAYPSHHLDSMRGLKDVSFIYLDEADFFPPGQQQDARDVSERYIAKSNPWIVMVSTPNAPEQLFDRIEHEPESTCLYKRLFLDYTFGLGRIYTEAEIAAAKQSPSFEREYNLKYLGLIGNVFHTKDIEAAIEKGKRFGISNNPNSYTQKSVGIDAGFGGSATGICITELIDGVINVLYADEFNRATFDDIINKVIWLLDEYQITFENRCRVFVDGSNPAIMRTIKERVDEDINYEKQIAFYKHNYPSAYDLQFLQQNMFVIPVPFNREHKQMLAHTKEMLEYHNGQVAINPGHTKLITALRTAVENGEGMLDKEATSHDDLFDAFRMSLNFWH